MSQEKMTRFWMSWFCEAPMAEVEPPLRHCWGVPLPSVGGHPQGDSLFFAVVDAPDEEVAWFYIHSIIMETNRRITGEPTMKKVFCQACAPGWMPSAESFPLPAQREEPAVPSREGWERVKEKIGAERFWFLNPLSRELDLRHPGPSLGAKDDDGMTVLTSTQHAIISELADTFILLGEDGTGIHAILGSWGESLGDEMILQMLRDHNEMMRTKYDITPVNIQPRRGRDQCNSDDECGD